MPNVCVDTNIWFYALAHPAVSETRKHQMARNLINTLNGPVLTPQIINELTVNLLRKRTWSELELRNLIHDLRSRCHFFIPDANWHEHASFIRDHYKLAFWDSLVVSSALNAGCNKLFSEDMQHQLHIDTLEIINPFI